MSPTWIFIFFGLFTKIIWSEFNSMDSFPTSLLLCIYFNISFVIKKEKQSCGGTTIGENFRPELSATYHHCRFLLGVSSAYFFLLKLKIVAVVALHAFYAEDGVQFYPQRSVPRATLLCLYGVRI